MKPLQLISLHSSGNTFGATPSPIYRCSKMLRVKIPKLALHIILSTICILLLIYVHCCTNRECELERTPSMTDNSYFPLNKIGVKLKQRLPQAIIIGVRKGGTRALIDFLDLHPKIEIADKEVQFFSFHHDKGVEWYKKQMPFTHNEITMEKSPSYFTHTKVPSRLYTAISGAKLILIVRDPVLRLI